MISQLLTGITKSSDTDLVWTLEATASLLQHVLLSGVELSITALEHIRSLINKDPSCRLSLTRTTTNDEELTHKDSDVNVTSPSMLRHPMANLQDTTPSIISTKESSNNVIVDDNVQSASTEKSHTTWPNFDPNLVGLKRSLPT